MKLNAHPVTTECTARVPRRSVNNWIGGECSASVEKPLVPVWQTPAFASEPCAFRSEPQTNRSPHPLHAASFLLHSVCSPLHEARGGQHGASHSLRDGGIHSEKREARLSQRSAHFMKQTTPFMKHATPAMRKTAHSKERPIFPQKSATRSSEGIIYSHRESHLQKQQPTTH